MSLSSPFVRSCLVVAAAAVLGGCQYLPSFPTSTDRFLGVVTPYKVEVVQGNVITSEQAALVKPGMNRAQVRDVLGSPLLADAFHVDRWDYVFTIRRQGVEPQERRLTVYFNGELMDRFEGDEMPSEEEFGATLDTRKESGKVPQLEASEDELKKFAPAKDEKADAAASVSVPPLPAAYPPLEAAR